MPINTRWRRIWPDCIAKTRPGIRHSRNTNVWYAIKKSTNYCPTMKNTWSNTFHIWPYTIVHIARWNFVINQNATRTSKHMKRNGSAKYVLRNSKRNTIWKTICSFTRIQFHTFHATNAIFGFGKGNNWTNTNETNMKNHKTKQPPKVQPFLVMSRQVSLRWTFIRNAYHQIIEYHSQSG